MKPGASTRPCASTTRSLLDGVIAPTSVMRPSTTRTAARRAGAPVPSTTCALVMTNEARSWARAAPPGCSNAIAQQASATQPLRARRTRSASFECVGKTGNLLERTAKPVERLFQAGDFTGDR